MYTLSYHIIIDKEVKKEDDNPYHNKKYQSQYAYEDDHEEDKGVDGAAGMDGR